MSRIIVIHLISLFLAFTSFGQSYFKGPALVEGLTSTVTAAGTTNLTKDSQTNQQFTGTTTQTVVLPDAQTLPLYRYFQIENRSTGLVTVQTFGGGALTTVFAGTQKQVLVTNIGTAAGTWDVSAINISDVAGVLPIVNGGTALSTTPTNGQLLIGNGTGYSLNTVTATTNQTTVTNGSGTITIGTAQDIATTSSPQFNDMTIDGDITMADAQFNNVMLGHEMAYQKTTGVSGNSVLSINANPALLDISAQNLSFSAYSTVGNLNTPVVKDVDCVAVVGLVLTNLASADSTYISVDDTCTVIQSTTFPTPQQRRTNAFIGRVSHPNRTSISAVSTLPDIVVDTNSQVYDLFDAIGAFNVSGNRVSPNGVNLSFNRSAGIVFRRSANYVNDVKNPNQTSIAAATPQTFLRATQTTINTTPVTTLDVANYDVAGTVTAVGGTTARSTNQRVYLFSNGTVGVQYGQTFYTNLANAVAGIPTESFVINPQAADGGILIAIISCRRAATDLSDPNDCFISYPGRFDQTGVTAGSTATTTLQQAYNNSVQPQITLTSLALGIQVRDASTPIGASLFAIQNNAGSTSYLGVDVNGITTTNFVGSGTVGAVRVHNLTTTQKNALTPAAGMIVYDTTLGRFECYNGAWVSCSSLLTTKGDLSTYSTTATRLPVGTNGQILVANSATTTGLEWQDNAAARNQSYEIANLGIATSVGSNALTINIVTSSGATPSAGSPVLVGFRNATAATGQYSQVSITGALSLTISSGSTLGMSNNVADYIYVYLINNAGTAELVAATGIYVDEGILATTTAEGGAGGADSRVVLYSTTARSNVPIRLIGRINITEATAGTWASNSTEISLRPFKAGSVTSNANSSLRIESAKIGANAAGSCPVTMETSDWISGNCTGSSTSICTCNITGAFSSAPICTFGGIVGNRIVNLTGAPTSTSLSTIVSFHDGTELATDLFVQCIGPR